MRAAECLDSKQKVKKVPKCPAVNTSSVDRVQDISLISRINNMAGKQEGKDVNKAPEKKSKQRSEIDANIIDASAGKKEFVALSPENLEQEINLSNIESEHLTGEKNFLEIKVIQAKKYFIDDESIYGLKSEFKGLAVIINNDEFTEEDYTKRQGSQVDVNNLSRLFEKLGLTVVVHENMTKTKTLSFIIDFTSDEAHAKADMMIFCMATHGPERSKLMSADCREIDIEKDILRSFNNENCPGLRGKPKFFIFQACQGLERDHGVLRGSQTDAMPLLAKTGAEPPGSPLKDPAWEDMLIAHATLPGFVSYRDINKGTWFIESLCKVLMEHSCDTSLRDMLDMVARMLKKYQTESGEKQSFKYEVIHFYKKLYLHPGLPPPQDP